MDTCSTLEIVNNILFDLVPLDPVFNDFMELKSIITKYYSENEVDQKAFTHFIQSEIFIRQNKLGDSNQI